MRTVLAEYAMGDQTPEWLQIWIQRYPDLKEELTNYTVQAALLDWISEEDKDSDALSEADQNLVQYGIKLLEEMTEETRNSIKEVITNKSSNAQNQEQPPFLDDAQNPPMASLSEYLESLGYNPEDVLNEARLSFTLLAMFNLGQISFESEDVCTTVVRHINEVATRTTVSAIAYYLLLRRRLGRGASYAKEEPQSHKQDFFEAVRQDPLIDPEDKEFWLELQLRAK